MNISDKVEGSTYTPQEFNQFKNENQNAIVSTGQSLAGNSNQLGQAFARYAASGGTYTDSSVTPNAYTLIAKNSQQAVTAYQDGAVYYFIAGGTNTGASTASVSGLGNIPIAKGGFSEPLTGGEITQGKVYSLYYSSGDNAFGLNLISNPRVEYTNRTLNIPNTDTFADIQAKFNSIGPIANNVIVTVEQQDSLAYTWGPGDRLDLPDNELGGFLVWKCEPGSETGPNNTSKPVRITGEGGAPFGLISPYVDGADQKVLVQGKNVNLVLIGDIDFVMSASAIPVQSSTIQAFGGTISTTDCVIKNNNTTGLSCFGLLASNHGSVNTVGTDFQIASGASVVAAAVASQNTGRFSADGSSGSAPYGYATLLSRSSYDNNAITVGTGLTFTSGTPVG